MEYYDELDVKFTAMMYEYYAIEGSKKVKQIKHMKQLNGQYFWVSAPYGYLKDPKDNHKLIIDKYVSEIIKKRFKMTLELKSKNKIVDELSDKVVPFKPNIETFLGITKDMCNGKYKESIILINEFYLNDNEKLNQLLETIDKTMEIVG